MGSRGFHCPELLAATTRNGHTHVTHIHTQLRIGFHDNTSSWQAEREARHLLVLGSMLRRSHSFLASSSKSSVSREACRGVGRARVQSAEKHAQSSAVVSSGEVSK